MLLIGLQSCRTDSVDGYEMKVLNEIFDSLIEEMGTLSEFESPPPTKIQFFDDNNNVIGYDTVRYKKKIDEVEKGNSKMRDTTFVIAVFDTLFTCYDKKMDVKYIQNQLIEQGYIEAFNTMKNHSIISNPLNLSEIGNRKRVTLKYYSEFPRGSKIWERENYGFLFSCILEISRINFDAKKQFGIFYFSYICGRLCGEEAIICIRKINNKWTIEKKILLGVS